MSHDLRIGPDGMHRSARNDERYLLAYKRHYRRAEPRKKPTNGS